MTEEPQQDSVPPENQAHADNPPPAQDHQSTVQVPAAGSAQTVPPAPAPATPPQPAEQVQQTSPTVQVAAVGSDQPVPPVAPTAAQAASPQPVSPQPGPPAEQVQQTQQLPPVQQAPAAGQAQPTVQLPAAGSDQQVQQAQQVPPAQPFGPPSPPASPTMPSMPTMQLAPVAPVPPYPGPPIQPVAPAAPAAPPDWWRAMAVGLLNLTGLGLGFVLMRRWLAAAVCWLATGILVLIALPATPNGIPIGVTVLYIAQLVLVAVLGAVRGLRTPLIWPPSAPVAFGMAVVLLVVPLGAAVLFDNARQEAYQQMLLKRLGQADTAITAAESEGISTAQPQLLSGLATYQDLLDHHGTSRAAKLVPGRLKVFYQVVSTPYTQADYCAAIEPLKFLRTLPNTALSAHDLGSLATFPDDPLATSLYQCGTKALGSKGDPAAATDLNDLMATFPTSAQAGKVEPAVAAAITSAAGGLTGSDPCSATTQITSLGGQISSLTSSVSAISAGLKKDVGTANGDVEAGTYDCAVSKYKGGDFAGAQTAMDSFVSTYPNDPNKALAQKYSIAAEIAQQDADAGKVTPTLTNGGSVSITIYNDSPDAVQILFTGPATGTVNIGACSSCKVYSSTSDAQANACQASTDYPKASFSLPPGTTYLLQKSTNTNVTDYSHSESYDTGEYQLCAYEKSPFGDLPGL